MKISILGTNGFLSTAIAKYANEVGWTLNMYGLDAPIDCEYSNFYKVNLMDAELDCSGLMDSDLIIYAIGLRQNFGKYSVKQYGSESCS